MARPTVTIKNVIADSHANKADERIVEFNSGVTNGPGGLISLKRLEDGTLSVTLYRLDAGVTVHVGEDRI